METGQHKIGAIEPSNRWLYAKAVTIGALTDTAGTMVVMTVLLLALAASGLSDSEVMERMKSPSGLLLSLIIGLSCTVLGGYVAGRIGTGSEVSLGAAVAVVGMVLGVFIRESGLPLWYEILGFAAMIPCGIVGGYFAAEHNRDKKDDLSGA